MDVDPPHRFGGRWVYRLALGSAVIAVLIFRGNLAWNELAEKRTWIVEPRRIVRGAWQRPIPLRRLIQRERIRTLLTLTAINRDDPKYLDQDQVAREADVDWIIVPMRGSTASLEQLAIAADIAADPRRQPVFFHCVAGHHRSNLVQAAIRIRHDKWSLEDAWTELQRLPWTKPGADSDVRDRALIERFALMQGSIPPVQANQVRELTHAISRKPRGEMDLSRVDPPVRPSAPLDRLD